MKKPEWTASLRVGSNSAHCEEGGTVQVDNGVAQLLDHRGKIVFAYVLRRGETITRVDEENYIVEL